MNEERNSGCRGAAARDLRDRIITAFELLHHKDLEWAWPFRPSIPFVGERYEPGKGLLIYASAENFGWIRNITPPDRYTSPKRAWDRYRAAYEEKAERPEDFFPYAGIQPVNDGGLLTAGLYISQRFGLATHREPRPFLETLAVSNWCKFTRRNNRDYISNLRRLVDSLPFVVAELAILRPAIVLLPNKAWEKPVLSAAMRGASPGSTFIPAFQFNTTVVNCRLDRFSSAAAILQRKSSGAPLSDWMNRLRGFNKDRSWRYIAYLESLCEST